MLVLAESHYQVRAGEGTKIVAPDETLEFLRSAKARTVTIGNREASGFVFGPNTKGDAFLLSASHLVRPGSYSLTLTATSDVGESRVATLDVVLNPVEKVPSDTVRRPVVLLNGWQFGFSNSGCPISSSSADTFGHLADQLTSDHVPVVYFFDNCVECPNCKIEDLGNTLGQFLNLIQYDTGALVPEIDVVTHSMGGLITRAYLAGLRADGSFLPPQNPRLGKIALIAEPNFGAFLATSIPSIFLGNQTEEMIPGSTFLWQLARWNQGTDDLRGVDAVAIIGNAGTDPSFPTLQNTSDGVVSITSASLGFARDPSRTRILPYCHIDSASFAGAFITCTGGGIADVKEAPETAQIVRSFLGGTSDWMSIGTTPAADQWLSQYGGIFFAVEGGEGKYLNDLNQVDFGSVALNNGGAANAVFYHEFIKGTDTFHATSSSVGQITYGPVTLPVGHFTTARAKFAPIISSVGPTVSNSSALLVQTGAVITINGTGFGAERCSGCQVLAVPDGSATGYPLQILSWTDQVITAALPGSFTGFVQLFLQTATGQDEFNVMAAAPRPALAGSMAQIASGGGWDTTLTLVNTSGSSGQATLNFFGNDGSPLDLPFTFPETQSMAGVADSSLSYTINGNALLMLDSQQRGNPNAQVGSAELLTSSSISGFATFKYIPTGQEAVVPLETRNAPSYLLAFDNTGVLAIGVALANVGTQSANIPVIIRDDTGAQIGTDTINLASQGHTSFMLTANYAATAGKRGTIEFDTPESSRISGLGLRANGSALTTIPVLANVTGSGGSMAHVASGGGWQTTFTLVNTGTSPAQAQMSFFDDNGNPLSLPLTFLQSGSAMSSTTLSQTIDAGASLVLLTQGSNSGASVVGSAQLITTGNVSGFAIFRYNPTGQEAVVPMSTGSANGYILAFDNTNGIATGVALANGSNQAVSVPLVLRDSTGGSLGTATVNLPANGHTSFILTNNYPSVAAKRGTIEVDTPAGSQISVLGLRATPTGAVTTIPVLTK
jgi:hypothetical protein